MAGIATVQCSPPTPTPPPHCLPPTNSRQSNYGQIQLFVPCLSLYAKYLTIWHSACLFVQSLMCILCGLKSWVLVNGVLFLINFLCCCYFCFSLLYVCKNAGENTKESKSMGHTGRTQEVQVLKMKLFQVRHNFSDSPLTDAYICRMTWYLAMFKLRQLRRFARVTLNNMWCIWNSRPWPITPPPPPPPIFPLHFRSNWLM